VIVIHNPSPLASGGQHGLVQSLRGISAHTTHLYANHCSVTPRHTHSCQSFMSALVAIYLLYGWLGPSAFVSLVVVVLLMPIKFLIFQYAPTKHITWRPCGL
jgi:hypothetical protein